MARIGKHGCFIEIPKTSTMYIIRCLDQLGKTYVDGHVHDIPHKWNYERIFTCVREPADWLASFWAHRDRNGWYPYPTDTPWKRMLEIMDRYKTKDFDLFIYNVTHEVPGIVGWFFGLYTPPRVEAIKMGPWMYEYLRKLGCDPSAVDPCNVAHNRPYLSYKMICEVKQAEAYAYNRWFNGVV